MARTQIGFLLLFLHSTTVGQTETTLPADRILMEFQGRMYPQRFLTIRGESFGHHVVTWKGGRTAKRALIIAEVSDEEVAETLAAKGLRAGNNLDEETWEARRDRKNPAADERVEGASVEILVSWLGAEPIDLRELLGLPEADFRFGDHRALIPVWRSGCIVCAVSCPGAKISNRALTIRDQAEGRLRSMLNLTSLPPDGTPVSVTLLRVP